MDANSIVEAIENTQDRFQQIAPVGMIYEREKGFVVQALKNDPLLMAAARANPASLQQAVTNIAGIGLSMNPAEKLVYFLVRNVKVKDPNGRDRWAQTVKLEPSYMGLCRIATDSGSIKWIQAKLVYSDDTFIDNGPGKAPTHAYKAFHPRGDLVGVYSVAKTVDGDYLTEVMDLSDVLNIRDRSDAWKSKKSGPWATDFNEQAKKTVIRRAYKLWPRTKNHERLSLAVDLSNENEGFEPIVSTPSFKHFNVEQKEYFDQLIESNNVLGMKVFSETVDEQVFIDLYHSFPKGEKGKYQRIVDKMIKSGYEQFQSYVELTRNCIQNGDQAGLEQGLGELDDMTITLIKNQLSSEELQIFYDMTK